MKHKRISQKTRVSGYYRLGLEQPSLEFLDVTLARDAKLFVDPRAFLAIETRWADECVALIRSFFSDVLKAIHDENPERARMLLSGLSEPNETRLGMSKGRVAGRGVGPVLADEIYQSLATSEAVEYGLIEHLEDTALLVEGIGVDRVSDITTNIVRGKLVEFTVEMAGKYGMEIVPQVAAGPIWDPEKGEWRRELISLLAPGHMPLILVPRTVARWKMDYDPGEYYRHYVLPFLQDRELEKRFSPIVQTVKSGSRKGERYVTKKDADRHYRKAVGGGGKAVAVDVTRDYPQVFKQFQRSKERRYRPVITSTELHEKIGTPKPKWGELLKAVTDLESGSDRAHEYHRAVEALLTPLFSPDLVDPKREKEVLEGTQRIDIRYRTMGQRGFFDWFSREIAKIPWVAFECKNYSADPKNPEIDQLAGRLNKNRGLLGFLVCRSIEDRDRFLTRCRGRLNPDGKYILGLDDLTLEALVEAKKASDPDQFVKILSDMVEDLID